MLHDDDLDAAVGAAIVTQAQADALREFATRRRGTGAAERADEEDFRFMRGFSDIFFAIGVVLYGAGVSLFAGMQASPLIYAVAAATMWGLAELLVRRMRLVLPGIAILVFFVVFAVAAIPLADLLAAKGDTSMLTRWTPREILMSGSSLQISIKAGIAALAAAAFYARFRFPFALLVIAGGAVAALQLAVGDALFRDAAVARSALLLLCGAVVFVFAMWFDLSDRLRATRRSDCAFWLHVLAAPLLVHSLIGLLVGPTFRSDNVEMVVIVFIALLLALVALIIDRRALLVSALAYVGGVIGIALSNAILNPTLLIVATLVIMGALVLALGIGWAALRRRVLSLLPPHLVDRLPPAVPA